MPKAKPVSYRIVRRTSVRASTDPDSVDHAEWVDFEPGQVVTSWPEHAPVREWLASGNWTAEKLKEKRS